MKVKEFERPLCGDVHVWERWPADKPLPHHIQEYPAMCGRCAARLARWYAYGIPMEVPLKSQIEEGDI